MKTGELQHPIWERNRTWVQFEQGPYCSFVFPVCLWFLLGSRFSGDVAAAPSIWLITHTCSSLTYHWLYLNPGPTATLHQIVFVVPVVVLARSLMSIASELIISNEILLYILSNLVSRSFAATRQLSPLILFCQLQPSWQQEQLQEGEPSRNLSSAGKLPQLFTEQQWTLFFPSTLLLGPS